EVASWRARDGRSPPRPRGHRPPAGTGAGRRRARLRAAHRPAPGLPARGDLPAPGPPAPRPLRRLRRAPGDGAGGVPAARRLRPAAADALQALAAADGLRAPGETARAPRRGGAAEPAAGTAPARALLSAPGGAAGPRA